MIQEEMIGGLLFQIQTTYRIYRSESDRTNGRPMITTSSKERFEEIMCQNKLAFPTKLDDQPKK